ncbi:possible part of outer membrane protein HorA [Helicobacter pylori F30]|nr:possible part of outer membrane protein HorA [Helicobacter pylori F30]
MLLGSMNATDLETYAALQKPSHVFGNYAVKKPLVANQLHQPHQLKKTKPVAVAHQIQAVAMWQTS